MAPEPSAERRRTSFGTEIPAEAYDQHRPSYPADAVHYALGAPRTKLKVLDLGAGTGKLSRVIAESGHNVLAVDPNAAMLAQLDGDPVRTVVGTAEAIPVNDSRVDAVVMGQAWHWVDPDQAVPEIDRVLKPGGVLSLLWNIRDGNEPWVVELMDAGVSTPGDPSKSPWVEWPTMPPPFTRRERQWFSNDWPIPASGLVALMATWSHVRLDRRRDEWMKVAADIQRRHAAPDGSLVLPHFCRVFRYKH